MLGNIKMSWMRFRKLWVDILEISDFNFRR